LSLLAVVGRGAWWLPGWLDRLLLDLDIEGARLPRQAKYDEMVEDERRPPTQDAEAASAITPA
jgi:RND superfamily putative drug exporter